MESGIFKRLPKSELTAFRTDLERQARLEQQALAIEVTDNGDETVDITWRVGAAAATPGDGAAGRAAAVAGGAAAGAAAGALVGGPIGAAMGAAGGAVAGAIVGSRPSVPPARTEIASGLQEAAMKVGVDLQTLTAIALIESSLKPDAKNPKSSAFGLFQFLDRTWDGVVGQHGATLGVVVGDRRDVRAQCLMGAAFLRDNAKSLTQALGHTPSATECYAAHFFGSGTAAKLLRGARDVRADDALGSSADAVIDANKSIFLDGGRVRSVGEVMAVFETKMARALRDARDLIGVPDAAAPPPAPPGLAAGPAAVPAWLAIARGEIGQKEAVGGADNPRIVAYFGATTLGPKPDSVAWCGAFVSFCLREAGVIHKGSARAADWLTFGETLAQPRLGCLAVLKPQAAGASGHVGFWEKTEGGKLHLLAGNQSDAVNVTPYAAGELFADGFRWPSGVP